MTKVEIPETNGQYFVKVSSDTLTYDEVLNSMESINALDGQNMTTRITEDQIIFKDEKILVIDVGVIVYQSTTYEGMTFTETGIYLGYMPEFIKETKLLVYE